MVKKGAIGSLGVLAATVVFLMAGCGGSNSDEPLTKADFVRKGNAICGKWQQARGKRFQEVGTRVKPPITQAKKEKALLFILEPYEDALDGLKELEPPAGEEKKVDEMIKAAEKAWAQGQASPGILISGSGGFNKSNSLFENYGLTECKV